MSTPTFTVLFCDGAVNNGKWNLIGVFDKVWLPKFPGSLPLFYVFIQITDLIIGDGAEVRIELVDAGVDEDGDMRNDLVWNARFNLKRGKDVGNTAFRGGVAIPVVAREGQLVQVDRPADYEIRVIYHGELQSLTVLPVGLKQTGGS